MPCGAQIEVVAVTIQRNADVEGSDHADLHIGLLPILPAERLDVIIREELAAHGWETEPDGSMTKVLGEVTATLPPGSRTIRISTSSSGAVSTSASRTEQITLGNEAARAAVTARAEADADRKLAAAAERERQKLEAEATARLVEAWQALRPEVDEATRSATRRALEQRAAELGSIDSIDERQGDNGYELTITVKT